MPFFLENGSVQMLTNITTIEYTKMHTRLHEIGHTLQ